MTPQEETKRALIVVRTYPFVLRSGVEVSCTAAITDKGEWLRLFPVPWASGRGQAIQEVPVG